MIPTPVPRLRPPLVRAKPVHPEHGNALQPRDAGPVPLPPTVDWRTRNAVTAIEDQGNCGSCVAFGTVAMLESMILIEHSLTTDLSEAALFFCEGAKCADGWHADSAISYVQSKGVPPAACFPYSATADAGTDVACTPCSQAASEAAKTAKSAAIFDVTQRKQYLNSVGPMVGCFTVYEDFETYFYGRGTASDVYEHVTGDNLGGHCVEIIGYDDTRSCWICKNSWGTGDPGGGFFQIGYGQCGIDSDVSFLGLFNLGSPFQGIWGTELTTGFGDISHHRFWTGNFSGGNNTQILFYSAGDNNWWIGTFNATTLSWALAGNTQGFGNVSANPFWTGAFSGLNKTQIVSYHPGDGNWFAGTFSANRLTWSLAGNTGI